MSNTLRLVLAATALAACSRSGTPARDVSTPATTASASGTVATEGTPADSISERADRGRILGDSTAPVWVIIASDFQCPFCKQWGEESLARVVKDYVNTGRARVAFLNMPLGMHANAVTAAEAAMCAAVQNKFWPMHDALFAGQASWQSLPDPRPTFDSYAGRMGLTMPLWRECMAKHLTMPLIEADRERAKRAGAGSTPTFFVDGQMAAGANQDIGALVDAALKKRAKPKPATN